MSDDIQRLEQKMDTLAEVVADIKVFGAINNQILKEHQKRSDMNEKAVQILTAELIPIKDHILIAQNFTKWIKILLGSGVLVEIARYFK